MSGISTTELQQRAHSLKRAPPPKTPQSNTNIMDQASQPLMTGIMSVKLRTTGMRKSLIEADFPGHKEESKENKSNELSSKLAKMKAKFESPPEEAESPRPIKPSVKPKPTYGRRPSEDDKENKPAPTPNLGMEGKATLDRPISSSDNRIRPLPLLQKLGPAPPKLPKPAHLKECLAKYSESDIVKYPRTNPVQEVESEEINGTDNVDNEAAVVDDGDEELYDDLMDIAETQKEVPEKNGTSVDTSPPDEGIMDENYDDIEAVAEQAKKMNEGLETKVESGSSSDADQGDGEDMYELIGQNLSQPPPTPTRSARNGSVPESPKKKNDKKGKKELEQQKKKEKEEMKKKKEEDIKREKERKVAEEKRKTREKTLRKKHKLKPTGNEDVSGTGVVTLDSKNEGKLELPVLAGEVMYLLNSTEHPPSGSWLVKNERGHIGYVPTEIVSVAVEEDLYDSLDVVKETVNSLPAPSVPPALPSPRISKQDSRKGPITDEVYDDVQDGEDEELYEAVGT